MTSWRGYLTLNFLVAVLNTLNTNTHSSKEKAEFSFENADVKSICYCKQWSKSKLSLSSRCVATKLCKPCTSFTAHLHSSCGMVWYMTLRLKSLSSFTLCRKSQPELLFIVTIPVLLWSVSQKCNYFTSHSNWNG